MSDIGAAIDSVDSSRHATSLLKKTQVLSSPKKWYHLCSYFPFFYMCAFGLLIYGYKSRPMKMTPVSTSGLFGNISSFLSSPKAPDTLLTSLSQLGLPTAKLAPEGLAPYLPSRASDVRDKQLASIHSGAKFQNLEWSSSSSQPPAIISSEEIVISWSNGLPTEQKTLADLPGGLESVIKSDDNNAVSQATHLSKLSKPLAKFVENEATKPGSAGAMHMVRTSPEIVQTSKHTSSSDQLHDFNFEYGEYPSRAHLPTSHSVNTAPSPPRMLPSVDYTSFENSPSTGLGTEAWDRDSYQRAMSQSVPAKIPQTTYLQHHFSSINFPTGVPRLPSEHVTLTQGRPRTKPTTEGLPEQLFSYTSDPVTETFTTDPLLSKTKQLTSSRTTTEGNTASTGGDITMEQIKSSPALPRQSIGLIVGSVSGAGVIFVCILYLHQPCYRWVCRIRRDRTFITHVPQGDDDRNKSLLFQRPENLEISRFSADT